MRLLRMRCDPSVAIGFCLIISTVVVTLFLYDYTMVHSYCQLHSIKDDDDGSEDLRPSGNHGPKYDRKTIPLIFIGGRPRSGTTLMRAMLDAHPGVRCGEETHLIPFILIAPTGVGAKRLLEAGITEEVQFAATGAFILELIVGHGEPADRLCNKDPLTLGYANELSRMFPKAQFILMIRDGRAVCHSMAFRNVGVGFDPKNMTYCLISWNRAIKKMYNDCLALGDLKCHQVRYEQLVLHPSSILTGVLEFLDVSWNDVVLHHETQINKPGGISLSRLEPSTDQVVRPVNLDSLTKWATFIPDDVKKTMRQLAPMLELLGYDPDAYPPNYGQPDKEVVENTLLIKKNQSHFEQLGQIAGNRTQVLDD